MPSRRPVRWPVVASVAVTALFWTAAGAAEGAPPSKQPAALRPDRHGAPLPPGAVLRIGTDRLRHGAQVNGIAFIPRGNVLVSTGEDGAVCFWDAGSGKQLRRFSEKPGEVGAVALSRDGALLAVAAPGAVRLWELPAGKARRHLGQGQSPAALLAFFPDGRALAAVGADGRVRLWDAGTGKEVGRWGEPGEVECAALSPDGKLLAVNGPGGSVRLCDPATGKERARLQGHEGAVSALAFSRDGSVLASGSLDETVRLWRLPEGKPLGVLRGHRGQVVALAWAAAGRAVVSASRDKTVRVWGAAGGGERRRHVLGDLPRDVAVSPDGKVIAAMMSEGPIRLWEVATGKELFATGGHQGKVRAVAFSPDGRRVASGSHDGTVRVWDAASGRELRRLEGNQGIVRAVAFSPDGKILGATGAYSSVLLWPLAADAGPGHVGSFQAGALAFSPDGHLLALADAGKSVRLWDLAGQKDVRRINLPGDIQAVAFSPDGKLLATAGQEGGPRLWDAARAREVRRLAGAPPSSALAFTPDGRRLVAAGRRGGLSLWKVATGEEARPLGGPAPPGPFALSPDGRTLAVMAGSGARRAIRLIETSTGRERGRLPGHPGPTLCLAFAPDSRRLASGGEDTTVLVWDVLAAAGPPGGDTVQLWHDLALADAARAYAAVAGLVSGADKSVAFLAARLQPAAAPDPVRLKTLLGNLSARRYAVREKAMRGLELLGELAAPALQELVASPPSLEASLRAEQLLTKADEPGLTPARLRELRALEVLEHVGTPAARHVLERLAGGAPGSGLTREARAALRRLAGRAPDAPH
jgi:WD40 repeat protein